MTACKQTTSLSNLYWLGRLTQPCQFRSPTLLTWHKVLCRRILREHKSFTIHTLDHQNESKHLFNLNLMLRTRLPVTTYLQMWRYTIHISVSSYATNELYQNKRSWKYILHWKYSQEEHLFAKQEAMNTAERASISSSVCQILLLLGKAKWKGKSKQW